MGEVPFHPDQGYSHRHFLDSLIEKRLEEVEQRIAAIPDRLRWQEVLIHEDEVLRIVREVKDG